MKRNRAELVGGLGLTRGSGGASVWSNDGKQLFMAVVGQRANFPEGIESRERESDEGCFLQSDRILTEAREFKVGDQGIDRFESTKSGDPFRSPLLDAIEERIHLEILFRLVNVF